MAAAALAMAAAWAPLAFAQEVYTCVDKSGRRLTADRPIAECVDREQRVLGSSGVERRRVGPTLTEHERAALEVQKRQEAEQRARVAEERRRERALTARYPDEAAHQKERVQAQELVDGVIAVAHKRIAELRGERKALDTEMEFYRRDPAKAPPKLQRQLAVNEQDVADQQRFIAGQEQEKRRLDERFDAELAQLRKLWAAQRAAASQWAPPPQQPPAAAPAP